MTTGLLTALCAALLGRQAQIEWTQWTQNDWSTLVDATHQHGVASLLYHKFATAGWPCTVPNEARTNLQQKYHMSTARSALQYKELARLLDALCPITPVLLIKGAVLGSTLYPDASLRPMNDIDLIIPRHNLERALQVVEALGYRQAPRVGPELDQTVAHHVALYNEANPAITVELHWNLIGGDADWRTPSAAWFWQQTQLWQPHEAHLRCFPDLATSLSTYRTEVLQLQPAAHLLYLTAHMLLQHSWQVPRLVWLHDIHLLVTSYGNQIDWSVICEQARILGWTAALHVALERCQLCFGTPLPAGLLDTLQGVDEARTRMFVEHNQTRVPRAARTWQRLNALRPWARLMWLLQLLYPTPQYMCWRYRPRVAWLWPLYYPYRWLHILVAVVQALGYFVRQRWSAETHRNTGQTSIGVSPNRNRVTS